MRYKRVFVGLTLAAVVAACSDEAFGLVYDVLVGTSTGTTFSPSTVTLSTKRPATFRWGDGGHNVTWQDGAPSSGDQITGTTYERDFTAAASGTYRFRCTNHSLPDNFTSGMVGQIIVP